MDHGHGEKNQAELQQIEERLEKENEEVVVLDDEVLVEEEEDVVEEVEEEEDTSTEPTVKQKKRAKSGAAAYNSKFNSAWTKEWPFIKQGTTEFHFWCEVCRHELECRHQGRADVQRHITRESHIKKQKILDSTNKMDRFVCSRAEEMNLDTQARRAEVKVAVTLVSHNIPSLCRPPQPAI
ncbi:hypothetical protein N1851_005167 [Merluccius polli]|uniref:Uncharacterized protein n=1 Tax=Merluccius polli TaxID=89951 RepID=A0AA47N7K8_MERPO|nr:hypothetical protein N1851_005167 [Merluccius polli]